MLGRMAGVMSGRDQDFAKFEAVAVLEFLDFELVLRTTFVARENSCRLKPRAQLARTAHQISMNVRFENVRDGHARFPGHLDENVAIRTRIEDRRYSLIIVTHEIGKLRDPRRLDGLKNERHGCDLT